MNCSEPAILRQQIYLDSSLLGAIPIDNNSLLASLYRDLVSVEWEGAHPAHALGLHHRSLWDSCSHTDPCCRSRCWRTPLH